MHSPLFSVLELSPKGINEIHKWSRWVVNVLNCYCFLLLLLYVAVYSCFTLFTPVTMRADINLGVTILSILPDLPSCTHLTPASAIMGTPLTCWFCFDVPLPHLVWFLTTVIPYYYPTLVLSINCSSASNTTVFNRIDKKIIKNVLLNVSQAMCMYYDLFLNADSQQSGRLLQESNRQT